MKFKNFWLRMIPVGILVIATIIMSFAIYRSMVKSEEEICWQRLEVATNSTAGKISTRITDNLNFLTTVADAYTLTHNLNDLPTVGEYLRSAVTKTVFDRIDIILPDNTVITQNGLLTNRGGEATYEELLARGAHVTSRITSSFTGKEVICCVTPIEQGETTSGLLVGTINCETLSRLFEVFTYGEEAQLFLVDRENGAYIMDNWHETLGSVYDLGIREDAYGNGMIDMVPAILNGTQTRFSYISRTNGERSFQYNAPVEGFNWTVCVVVQEDVVFANVKGLQKSLLRVGVVEFFVILVYVLWNLVLNFIMAKNGKKVKQLEYTHAKNEARATFISNMSHDIRTPLNGIVGMLAIIKGHREDSETVDDCLEKIEVSAQYLATLAGDMLDISEIENNKLILPNEPVNLQKLAAELTFMMDKQAKDVGVHYELDLSGLHYPHVMGSNVHIKRILVNLIGNAIKYSKNAGRRVWVTFADEAITGEDTKRMYRFVIRDNGIGMSEEFQKNMYQAFEQETVSARSEYEGYGLGLTIVNHLTKKMGGSIDLESTKGIGSTFTVSIPLVLNRDEPQQASLSQELPSLHGMHLLLVEDNEFNMQIAYTLLCDMGAEIDTAVNGKLALERFSASPLGTYDAIIMDVMMPIMDGCEATKAIRLLSRPDAAAIPIIAMTANTFSEDIERCLEAGMNAHLPKPFKVEDAVLLLRSLKPSNETP